MTHSRTRRSTLLLATIGLVAAGLGAGWAAAPAGAATAAGGWIRFAHFAPSTGAVRVTVDGTAITGNASFQTVTPYQSLSAGTHTVTVATQGASSAALSGVATVGSGGAVTVAAVDGASGLQLEVFTDTLAGTAPGQASVRIIQAVGTVASVSAVFTPVATAAATSTGTPAAVQIPTVAFGAASAYASIPAGTYQVSIKGPAGQQVVAGTNWPVVAGTVASLAVIQSTSGPTLEVLRDAVGAASPPAGGMATGLGGTAPRPHAFTARSALLAAAAALVALGVAAGGIRRRRRAHALAPTGSRH